MSDSEIEKVLVEWGRWSRGGCGGRVQQVIVEFGGVPNISDEMALRVEQAVIAAGSKNNRLQHVLVEHFQKDTGLIDLAWSMRIGRHKLDKILAEAIGFVGGYLSNFKKAA